jgi:hypothetical protein
MNLLELARAAMKKMEQAGSPPENPSCSSTQPYEKNEVNEKRSDPDLALAAALSLIAHARQYTRQPARQNVLTAYEETIRRYHAEGDPLLFEAGAAVEKLLARWKEDDCGHREPDD